jgi:hypothetical protein
MLMNVKNRVVCELVRDTMLNVIILLLPLVMPSLESTKLIVLVFLLSARAISNAPWTMPNVVSVGP